MSSLTYRVTHLLAEKVMLTSVTTHTKVLWDGTDRAYFITESARLPTTSPPHFWGVRAPSWARGISYCRSKSLVCLPRPILRRVVWQPSDHWFASWKWSRDGGARTKSSAKSWRGREAVAFVMITPMRMTLIRFTYPTRGDGEGS